MELIEPQWDTLPEESKGLAILESESELDQLTTLSENVGNATSIPTLESYRTEFLSLANRSTNISVEHHLQPITRKTELYIAINERINRLNDSINLSLESYSADIEEDFHELVKTYGQSYNKLLATDSDIDITSSEKIAVNHTRIFDMFLIKDDFKGKEPLQTIRSEIQRLNTLVVKVKSGVARLSKDVSALGKEDRLDKTGRDLPEQPSLYLMFNRRVKIEQGQFDSDQRKARGPKKTHSWGQHAVIIFSELVFGFFGGELARLVNKKKDSEAKVTNSLSDIHKYIRTVESLEEIVEDLTHHVMDLIKLFGQVDEDQKSALNRRTVPIMELAMFIMKQCIDITNGTDKLFTRLVRKNSAKGSLEMAKVSPTMKHAQPKLSAEQAAIEDFINSIPPEQVIEGDSIIDNSIPETMVVEETCLEPIIDSAIVADSMDQLADDAATVTTAAGLESYKRIFTQMGEMTGHPVATLEAFPATKGGVKQLTKAIRAHAAEIRNCVQIALEDFAGNTEESIGTSVSNFKQALGQLAKIKESDLDTDKQVTLNHKDFWKILHVNEDLVDLSKFDVEVKGIKELAEYVTKGKDHIVQWSEGKDSSGHAIEGKAFILLLNNTDVTIKDGRAKFDEIETPEPPKAWTGKDWFWNVLGGVAAQGIRGTYKDGGGSGERNYDHTHSVKNIMLAINSLKALGPVVQKIEKDAKEIVSKIDNAKEDRKADLKRAAAPVLELASKTIQHVTKVTYGINKLFQAATK